MKNIFRKLSLALAVIMLLSFVPQSPLYSVDTASAATKNKVTILKTKTKTLYSKEYSYGDEPYSYSYTFTTKKAMVFQVPVSVTPNGYPEKGGFKLKLVDKNGKVYQNDKGSIKGANYGETYEWWFYNDDFIIPAGTYTYTITNTSDEDLKFKFSIAGFTKVANKATVKKSVSVRSGNWVKIGKIENGLPYVKSVSYSNKKYVSDYRVEANGNVYAWGKKAGKSTITIKLKNGKKYKTKVVVKPGDPNFQAELYDYKTRDNYFVVKVKNNSSNSVTILRSGGKVEDVDYKSFDRKLKSSKSITVKPGKTKYIRFYVSGRTTWYKYSDFTLFAKFKYEGVTYTWHVWDEDSVYKRGKHWYSTYW